MMLGLTVLARIYGPVEIGLYAIFASVAAIMLTVSCMRYEMAIPVVSRDALSSAILVSFAAAILMSLIIALMVPIPLFFPITPFHELGMRLWLLPILVLMGGLAQIGTYLSIRFVRFKANALYKFSQPLLFIILALLLPGIGLPAAYTLSFIAVLVFFFFYSTHIPVTVVGALDFAKEHRHYTLALMPAAFMDAAATALPLVFIGTFYGTASAGNFSIIQRLTAGPLLILAAAVSQIFFGVCSEKVRNGSATTSIVLKSLLLSGLVVICWLVLVLFTGEYLLHKILGSAWQTDRAHIMLVMAVFIIRVMVSPLSTLLIAVNNKRRLFYWQTSYFISCVTVLLWGAANLEYFTFLKLYVAHESVFYFVYLLLIYNSSKRYSLRL